MANAICLLYDMCRLCLDEPGIHDILKSDKLIQDILLCTGIMQISCTDKLPRKICSTCVYKIETAKDLRKYSTKNDLYMQSLLDSNSTIVHEIARPKVPLGLVKPLEEIVSSSTETEGDTPKIFKKRPNDKNIKSQNNSPPKSSARTEKKTQKSKDSSPRSSVTSVTTVKKTKKRKTKMKTRICKPKPLSGAERQRLCRLRRKEDQKTETNSNRDHQNDEFRLIFPISQPSTSVHSLNIAANVVPMHIDYLEKTNIKNRICKPKPLSGAEKQRRYRSRKKENQKLVTGSNKLDPNNERQNLTFTTTQPLHTSAPSLNVIANVLPTDVDDLQDRENINIAAQSKISVRSLADINSSVLPPSSSAKREASHKKKISNSASPDGRKTETNNKHKCDSSSGKHNTSPVKKTKRSVSTEDNKSGDNGEHECDVCKKTYPTPRKLYMHRRSHSKTLYCPLDACGKNFATKGDLQKHIRSHTGEKPYKCDLCDKSFTQNVTLKSHKEAVHIDKM